MTSPREDVIDDIGHRPVVVSGTTTTTTTTPRASERLCLGWIVFTSSWPTCTRAGVAEGWAIDIVLVWESRNV